MTGSPRDLSTRMNSIQSPRQGRALVENRFHRSAKRISSCIRSLCSSSLLLFPLVIIILLIYAIGETSRPLAATSSRPFQGGSTRGISHFHSEWRSTIDFSALISLALITRDHANLRRRRRDFLCVTQFAFQRRRERSLFIAHGAR